MHRLERVGIVVLVALVAALPTAIHGWPTTVAGNAFTALLLASGLTLLWWREHPRLVAVLGGAAWLLVALLGDYGWFPDTAFAIMALLARWQLWVGPAAPRGWSGSVWWCICLFSG
ncbi:hypothetical protein EV646_10764 [Kribbella antiqua]|uniref:Uncharacterized protein n=1 Tax=Kribbella antiqua TaxID=2512217 RepID=A0A4R2ILX7_9ACTN|nr:hypothetical protein [Kribbella antiqua]TCO46043.1 hypothetical protein EV646_10764 [Kribbella antiqua]